MGARLQVAGVPLLYRREAFARIKERNAQRIQESMRSGKLTVLFNSAPTEFRSDTAYSRSMARRASFPMTMVGFSPAASLRAHFSKKSACSLGVGTRERNFIAFLVGQTHSGFNGAVAPSHDENLFVDIVVGLIFSPVRTLKLTRRIADFQKAIKSSLESSAS